MVLECFGHIAEGGGLAYLGTAIITSVMRPQTYLQAESFASNVPPRVISTGPEIEHSAESG